MIKAKILPPQAANYRLKYFLTWDTETLEKRKIHTDFSPEISITDKTGLTYLTQFRFVSIGIGTNFNDITKVFVQKDSSPDSALKLTDDFLDFLIDINEMIPVPKYFCL